MATHKVRKRTVSPGDSDALKISDVDAVAVIADLTHAVGTADGTVDDVGASFNQTTLNNNFREVTDQLDLINAALQNAGITNT